MPIRQEGSRASKGPAFSRIDAPPEELARILMRTPPKKSDEVALHEEGRGRGPSLRCDRIEQRRVVAAPLGEFLDASPNVALALLVVARLAEVVREQFAPRAVDRAMAVIARGQPGAERGAAQGICAACAQTPSPRVSFPPRNPRVGRGTGRRTRTVD